jgi:hypothetical protein
MAATHIPVRRRRYLATQTFNSKLRVMKTAARIVPLVLAGSLGVLVLAGCSAAANAAPDAPVGAAETAIQPVSQVQETTTADENTETLDDPCAATPSNRIDYKHQANGGAIYASLRHDVIDLGESGYAQGEVTLNDAGDVYSYTVAPGDSPIAIGDRFCIDYITVLQYNHTWPEIDPGEVLILRPNPEEIWGDDTPVDE